MLVWMAPSTKQLPVQLPAVAMLWLQCQETVRSVRLFENWVAENPWLAEAVVDFAMPRFAYVCFNRRSKGLVLAHFGGQGWRVMVTGELRKEIGGVTVAVAGD